MYSFMRFIGNDLLWHCFSQAAMTGRQTAAILLLASLLSAAGQQVSWQLVKGTTV